MPESIMVEWCSRIGKNVVVRNGVCLHKKQPACEGCRFNPRRIILCLVTTVLAIMCNKK